MEPLLNFAMLWGLELAALLVLLISGVFARWLEVVLVGGILAALLMAAHVALWLFITLVGSAGSGSQESLSIALRFAAGSLVALALYFPLAIARHRKLRRLRGESR